MICRNDIMGIYFKDRVMLKIPWKLFKKSYILEYDNFVKNNFAYFDKGCCMHRKITFRSMDHSDAIEEDIHKKLDKLDKFFKHEQEPITMEVVVEAHRTKHYFIVEFKIQSKHYNMIARSEGADMYAMIDQAGHKIERDIAREKERLVDKEHHRPKMQ